MICATELILLGRDLEYKNEFGDNEDGKILQELVGFIRNGDFKSVITHPVCEKVVTKTSSVSLLDDFESSVTGNVTQYVLCKKKEDCIVRQLIVLCIAVGHVQFFVQHSWVGPATDFDTTSLILDHEVDIEEGKTFHHEMIDRLSVDGEVCYNLLKQSSSMYMAKLLLFNCKASLQYCQTADWWLLNCLRLHQWVVEERSFTLKTSIMELIDKLSEKEFLKAEENKQLAIQFHLEAAYLHIYYYRYKHGQQHLDEAIKLSQLSVKLTGVMGKRTKFQVEDLAQLVAQVIREGEMVNDEPGTDGVLTPVDVALNDETVLDRLKFSEGIETEEVVTMIEQALLIGMCVYNKKNSPGDEITAEQTQAYLCYIVTHATNWCVKTIGLFLRSIEEKASFRRQERCMMQIEELVNQFHREQPPVSHRLRLFHAVELLPMWLMEKEFADFLFLIGSTNTALDVFERLQLWEDVIRCYGALGRVEKAEQLIREQLAIKETPILLCYLGDVTKDITNYQKAWDLSKKRSARSMRSLGYHYLRKEQHQECLECFEKTLHVNRLQRGVWFSYGCAALMLRKFDEAIKGFRSSLEVDSDNAEAWNNLASAYVQLKNKPRACRIYREAVKFGYENWRIWTNFMMVSADCGEFRDTIRAYNRILDIKGRFTDGEVLQILVKAVNKDLPDADGNPASKLRPKVREMFGKITSKVTSESVVWRCYAELISGPEDISQEDKERAAQFLQKAQRCVTQQPNWQKDIAKCKEVTTMSLKVVESYKKCCEGLKDADHAKKLLSSARLMVKSVMSNIKQSQTDPVTSTLNVDIEESVQQLENAMQQVVSMLEQLSEQ